MSNNVIAKSEGRMPKLKKEKKMLQFRPKGKESIDCDSKLVDSYVK